MPTIVHFEIPADDVERSRKFYTDLFGWKIEKWPGMDSGDDDGGSSNMEYWISKRKRKSSITCTSTIIKNTRGYVT